MTAEKELSGSLAAPERYWAKSAARAVWLDMRPLKARSTIRPWRTGWPARSKSSALARRAGRRLGADPARAALLRLLPPCRPESATGARAALIRARYHPHVPTRSTCWSTAASRAGTSNRQDRLLVQPTSCS